MGLLGFPLLIAGAFCWVRLSDRELTKPILDGRPITFWLNEMGVGDHREEIRARLLALGPTIKRPLLAALYAIRSPSRTKFNYFVENYFQRVLDKYRPN